MNEGDILYFSTVTTFFLFMLMLATSGKAKKLFAKLWVISLVLAIAYITILAKNGRLVL